MTFKEYIEVFFDEKELILSPVTVVNYRRELEKAATELGMKEMSDIGFFDMKTYFTKLQKLGINSYNNHLLKHSSLVQHYIILHAFYENACENEIIPVNPMLKLKRPRQRKEEVIEEPVSYSEEEVKYILKCVKLEKPMWKALMFFMIDSGCRCGEAMALKWEEIDFNNGKVNICRNVQYTSEKGVYICSPKNGKNREIYLNNQVLDIMYEWKSDQRIKADTRNVDCRGFCFTKLDGSLMMPGCFNAYLCRFGKKYGINGIHPHALRHTMATLSISNGADIVSVSKKLGHSKVAVTLNIYSHANEKAQKRSSEILAEAIY